MLGGFLYRDERITMRNKHCPDCHAPFLDHKGLWLNALFNKKIFCRHCNVRLKLEAGILSDLLSEFFSQLILLLGIVAVFYFQTWLAFIVAILFTLIMYGIFIYFGRLVKG